MTGAKSEDGWMIRSQVEYRGVVVGFLLEGGRLRRPAVTCALPLRRPLSLRSGDGRLFQGGVVRISWLVKNVYIASPLISNRPLFFSVPKTHSELCSFSDAWLSLSKRLCWQPKWVVCSGSVESAASGRLLAGNRSQRAPTKSATDLLFQIKMLLFLIQNRIGNFEAERILIWRSNKCLPNVCNFALYV